MSEPEQPYQPYQPPSAPLTTFSELRQRRMYSPKQVAAAALLGSPIAGAWLMASNYSTLDKPDARRRALLWGTLSTVAVFVLALILPENFPNAPIPLAYTLALYRLASTYQGKDFAAHLAGGGRRYSSWRVVGIAVAFFAVVFVVAVGAVLLLPDEFLPE